jgi:hypothetical protein
MNTGTQAEKKCLFSELIKYASHLSLPPRFVNEFYIFLRKYFSITIR